jgi:phosphate-selective porin OprO and OprP
MRTALLQAFLVLLLLAVHAPVAAQQQEVDETALLEVKDGINVKKDSLFLLNLRFRMQNRLGMSSISGDDLSVRSVDARVRRLRLRLDGFVLNRNIRYYIQLNFSRADLDLVDQNTVAHPVRDAMVYYHFNKRFYLGFGQSKLPGNRQRVVSSGNLQFPDRSIANGLFTLDRDFGVFAYWTPIDGPQQVQVKAAFSTGDGRNALPNNEGMAYTGRLEWLPFGAFTRSGDYSEGDLEFEQRPKLSFAGTYSYNDRAVRTQGQLGNNLYGDRDMTVFIADMMFKYRGWAVLGEYFERQADDPITMNEAGAVRFIPTGTGVNGQLSRYFRNGYEVAGRYTQIEPGKDMTGLMMRTEEVLLGGTKYLNGHRIKLQLYGGYRWFDARMDDPASFWTTMFQVEFGI